tara:strand:- start:99 stop:761 length:663 start_codon:yes stop_codon:yes gene_type:complete
LEKKVSQQYMFFKGISSISQQEAIDFILPKHYSGRIPSISRAFGWFSNAGILEAVVTFGKPASHTLCDGVCGKEYSEKVYELNRLCRIENSEVIMSQFVSKALKELSQKEWIIVSYADLAMNHHGYIYQATNFIYTGTTVERTDKYTEGNKHSRHYDKDDKSGLRKVRSPKHRYIYFTAKKKSIRKAQKKMLKYPVLDYPKGKNKNYKLGFVLKTKIIET